MKRYLQLFGGLFILLLVLTSCEKNPPKGHYTGTFKGSYTNNNQIVNYVSYYQFQITKSTKNTIVIQEKSTNVSSTLQHQSNDSIVGAIGFGSVYDPSGANGTTINMIYIRGKCIGKNPSITIEGTFEGKAYSQTGEQSATTGTFILSYSS